MIAIVGKSGSGKNTIVNKLLENGMNQIITYTTRPMRDGEIAGVTYNYVTDEEFDRLESEGFFVETTSYEVTGNQIWKYGTSIKNIDDYSLIIINPKGIDPIKNYCEEHNIRFVSFYIDVDDEELKKRLINRGDNEEEISRRLEADRDDFALIRRNTDYAVPNGYNDGGDIATTTILNILRYRVNLNV